MDYGTRLMNGYEEGPVRPNTAVNQVDWMKRLLSEFKNSCRDIVDSYFVFLAVALHITIRHYKEGNWLNRANYICQYEH
ncbi:hypothetical protein SAMN04487895_10935 [Paenibacillus sophorae]|uniref:Uncharacterized protein n=1 Tax=Paenibacillus sophorae TaxID=1333845 RepID=A0A1H8QXD1_9BACL|nr:hypothetical protein [Paenibacillus sophorae]QWU14862.1 hypothetical protein KP014_23550 [Paenibacillus sophorae]SEO58578.1 hypothetical protein SAMN04487895_10935 [Paenibacillus sophorae]